MRFIPKAPPIDNSKKNFDFPGLVLLGLGIISAMYATTYLGEKESSFQLPLLIGLVIVSIISFTLFFVI